MFPAVYNESLLISRGKRFTHRWNALIIRQLHLPKVADLPVGIGDFSSPFHFSFFCIRDRGEDVLWVGLFCSLDETTAANARIGRPRQWQK